jgi:hypothetical protein
MAWEQCVVNCVYVELSASPPLRHSATPRSASTDVICRCSTGKALTILTSMGPAARGQPQCCHLRRAWLVKDADDPSIFSAFGKKQAAQTFAPAAGCRLAVINPHPQKQNVPVRQVVSRAGSRNKGWANRRLRVCDGVLSLGNDGEGKFLDKNYSGDESKFLGCWWPCLDADRSNFMLLDQGAPEQPRH